VRFVTAIVVSVLLLGGASAAQAQDEPMSFGVKVGVTFSNLSADTDLLDFDFESRTGAVGGIFVAFPLATNLYFQPEALVTMKGAKLSALGEDANTKLTYLDIPVLLRYNIPLESTSVTPYVYAGPSFGLLLSAKQDYSFDGGGDDVDIKDEMKDTEFGWVLGAGVQIQRFMIEARYTQGFTDIEDEDSVDFGDSSVKNKAFMILAGVRF
jgi:opacity protein-like surface antigen